MQATITTGMSAIEFLRVRSLRTVNGGRTGPPPWPCARRRCSIGQKRRRGEGIPVILAPVQTWRALVLDSETKDEAKTRAVAVLARSRTRDRTARIARKRVNQRQEQEATRRTLLSALAARIPSPCRRNGPQGHPQPPRQVLESNLFL